MKLKLTSAILLGASLGPLDGQILKRSQPQAARPAVIEEAIRQTGRFPQADFNRDGWDDLWLVMYPKVDVNRPWDDLDGDGKSNYLEMLDHQDPYRANKAMKIRTPGQIANERKLAALALKASDDEKFRRFQSLLQSRGVLTNPLPIEPKPNEAEPRGKEDRLPPKTDDVPPTTSCIDAGILEILQNPQLLITTPETTTLPRILGIERLSNGRVLLAWEGSPDKLYTVEWSDDLIDWKGGTSDLPTVNGLGTWGQISHSPKRFYRVVEDLTSTTTPSDPLGGNGTNTFGATLSFNSSGSTIAKIVTIQTHLPDQMEPMLVELFIDGERYDSCEGEGGTYTCYVSSENISRGAHTAYVKILADHETTPSPFNPPLPSAGILRSPETTFENTHPLITGIRLTAEEINGGDPTSPTSTTLSVEYPAFGGPDPLPYTFRLTDENENIVREWQGSVPDLNAGQLDIEWNGTDQNGVPLPAGPYYMNFFFTEPSDSLFGGPILIKHGEMPMKILALAETFQAPVKEQWGLDHYENYYPRWHSSFSSSGYPSSIAQAWGPWGVLKAGPVSMIESFRLGIGRAPKAHLDFWLPYNEKHNSPSTPWAKTKTTPADDFFTKNPFNDYDLGILIGHGVASSGGTYTLPNGTSVTKTPQHYFPFISNGTTGGTVWIESGNMAEKYGATGRLKWMFVATCNFFRVGAHEDGSHDIYDSMVASGTLPMGNGLHVLCGYTTSIDLGKDLGDALSKGLAQQAPGNPTMTVVEAWNFAWQNSSNSKDIDAKGHPKQIRNARSVFWPECENDTIMKVPNEHITNPTAPFNLGRLKKVDSKFP